MYICRRLITYVCVVKYNHENDDYRQIVGEIFDAEYRAVAAWRNFKMARLP